MIDILIEIPGPQFLFLFIFYSALCIFIGWYANKSDGSERFSLPPATAFDGYTVAVLRGGWNTALESALYGLWKRDLMDLKPSSHILKGSTIQAVRKINRNALLNAIEKIVYDFFHHKRNLQEIFQDKNVKEKINSKIEPIVQQLRANHLLKEPAAAKRSYIIMIATLFAIYLVGVTKLYYGIIRYKPVGFMAVVLLLMPVIVFFLLKPGRPQTALGLSYLDSLKEKFGWIKQKALSNDLSSIDPVFAASIFGVAALSTDPTFAGAMNRYTGHNTGGCASSGCGGGGCGGGGCGGGCGGCGGCG